MTPQISMFDKSETNPSELLLGAMSDVASGSWYEAGFFVSDFEHAFAQMLGVDHCVSCASGTDALILALKALECTHGDQIALVANAGFYGSTAVHTLRATPVYVDVDDELLCMCPAALEDVLKDHSIKAVIVTHLYGQLADITAIAALCRSYGVALIEDCAQACGAADSNGSMAGSYGDIACFSFYPTKNLGGCGEGGAFVAKDEAIHTQARHIRVHGSDRRYYHDIVGGNFRMDGFQGALLNVKLPHLATWTARRQAIAARYLAGIKLADTHLPAQPAYGKSVFHQFTIRHPRRDALREHLAKHEIGTDLIYPVPLHLQKCYASLGYGLGAFPVSELTASTCVSLPIFPELTDAQVDHVIASLNAF
jgi:dTDP-4-amino-4,6-dideoxygalactose transaminase